MRPERTVRNAARDRAAARKPAPACAQPDPRGRGVPQGVGWPLMGQGSFSDRARVLADLNDNLTGVLTPEWLTDFRADRDPNGALFGTAIGQIRWPQSIGRPVRASSGVEIS